MSWSSRFLTVLYVTTGAGLAWTAVLEFRHGPVWASCLFGAAGLVPLIAAVRESVLCDLRRAVRRAGEAAAPDAVGTEAVVRAELEAACCERWWTSLGTDHDAGCAHGSRRSSAA
ncbi:hypothetical protein MTQ10_06620 [Streptomyces sp. XM83C]|uniref:Uncharacterized protein n=1 Tax=Streptomyces thermocoprophilus TaxID=78356 RepID=A0ABV5V772_9ACTN|nr:hypothetical protein [Streptomyces sp. XM83C]MCK1819287.1 hypothetical protein [Streptomyces sp. XM83C]